MNKPSPSIFRHYGIALVSVSVAVLLSLLLEPLFAGSAPLLVFTLCVMLAASYGGFGPGLFATVLSILVGAYLFFEPIYSFGVDSAVDRTRIILFAVVGVLTSALCESLRRAKKRAESETLRARESEEQFRTMANSIPQLVWTAHADGHIFWYNRRWFDYTGTTPEQMEGWGWQAVHDAEILPQVLTRWREAIAKGESFEMKFPLRGADGAFRTFLTRVEPLKDSNGAVVRWFGTNTDVDELRRAEEAVARSERHLRRVLNNLFAFVGVLLPDGTLIEANRAPLESAGITLADVYGKKVWDTYWMNYDPEVRKQIREACERAAAGETCRFDIVVQMTGGALMPIDFMIAPMRSEDGEITHLIPSAMDITVRKTAEEESNRLNLENERQARTLDTILSSISEFIGTFDKQGRFQYANKPLLDLLDKKSDEMIGKNFLEIGYPSDLAATMQRQIREVLDTGKSVRDETLYQTVTGEIGFFEYIVNPLDYADGKIEAIVISGRELTERRRAEAALRHSTEQLRALSARLQSAREEESTRISREIHDELGQSLTGIIIELSWLEEQLFERDDGADLIAKIRGTITIAAGMVDTVRRIATELRPGLLDDFGLTATVEWQAQEFEKRTGIECKLNLDNSCANLPRQISTTVFRILQESLTNVARHASASRVNIELFKTNDSLEMSIADNGRGALENELADSRSLGVLGMRERALLLGGEVKISGVAGAGTVVEVSIPLSAAPFDESGG